MSERPQVPPRINDDALEVARRLPPALAAHIRRALDQAEAEGLRGPIVVQIRLDRHGRVAPDGHAVQPAWYHA